jgi:hypothetical protein
MKRVMVQSQSGSRRLDDGVSFIHIVSLETPGSNPLIGLSAFKEFAADIKDRCLKEVASYRFFGRLDHAA